MERSYFGVSSYRRFVQYFSNWSRSNIHIYLCNNNFFNPDESLNRIDFYDSLELYHGSYHFYGIEKFLPEEFFEFYRFISIIIEDDETFINMLNQEWSPRLFNKSNVSDNIKECNFVEKKMKFLK